MSQDTPQLNNNSREVVESQTTSALDWRKGPTPDEIVKTFTLRDAQREFGLSHYQIYLAIRRRELRPIQPGGKGRIYYLEDELKALSQRVVQPWVRRVA